MRFTARQLLAIYDNLSMDWQDEHFNPEDVFDQKRIDRSKKTGEQLRMITTRTEAGDHLTVANSEHHPGRWGYTILSDDHLNNSSGLIFNPDGSWAMEEPLGAVGHRKDQAGFQSPEEAMMAAEQHYYSLDHSKRKRTPEDSGVDYSDLNSYLGRDDLDDNYGDIFGGR